MTAPAALRYAPQASSKALTPPLGCLKRITAEVAAQPDSPRVMNVSEMSTSAVEALTSGGIFCTTQVWHKLSRLLSKTCVWDISRDMAAKQAAELMSTIFLSTGTDSKPRRTPPAPAKVRRRTLRGSLRGDWRMDKAGLVTRVIEASLAISSLSTAFSICSTQQADCQMPVAVSGRLWTLRQLLERPRCSPVVAGPHFKT